MTFEEFCSQRRIYLTPLQVKVASEYFDLIKSNPDVARLFCQIGSGCTFLHNVIEQYCKAYPIGQLRIISDDNPYIRGRRND